MSPMALLYQGNRGHPKAANGAWLRRRGAKANGRKLKRRQAFLETPSVTCASPLTLRILQASVEQMVLPDAVDAEIFARITLAHEADIFQEPDRSGIGRDAGRFQPVQPQGAEGERDHRTHRRRHVALPDVRKPHPVTEAAGLRDAASDIGQR